MKLLLIIASILLALILIHFSRENNAEKPSHDDSLDIAPAELKSQKEIDEFLASHRDVTVIFYGTPNSKEHMDFLAIYQRWRNLCRYYTPKRFRQVLNPELFSKEDENKIFAYTHVEPMKFPNDEIRNFENFLISRRAPTVKEIEYVSSRDFSIPTIILFYNTSNEMEINSYLNLLHGLARDNADTTFDFKYVNVTHENHGIGEFGKNSTALPFIGAYLYDPERKYVYSGEIKRNSINQWIKSVSMGFETPFIISQDIPKNIPNTVQVVVGRTFKSIVFNKKKNVFLMIYAPWSGHCKNLLPKMDALAEHFRDHPDVVIAKIDGTANDLPIYVYGFPTLLWFPKGNKTGTSFEGIRSVESMHEFILKPSK